MPQAMSQQDNNDAVNMKQDLNFLLEYDTHFIVDDGQSMFGDDWKRAKEALLGAASTCAEYDTDGFSISFFHHEWPKSSSWRSAYSNIKCEADVEIIFKIVRTATRNNSKPAGKRLKNVLDQYSARLNSAPDEQERQSQDRVRPVKVVLITDGIPTDDFTNVLALLDSHMQTLESQVPLGQISVEIWQVGNHGPTTAFFHKTGKLRNTPRMPLGDVQRQPRWKYDLDDTKKARPSKNFAKFMFTNLLQSTFLRT